jgi:coenzyme F420-0:L-glutamate ligase / coenzyme F420-1:gamma-L-glutamate ligase
MNPVDALKFVRARRMIRRYSEQPVSEHDIQTILQSACHAPSPHNRQPWRFAVITDGARARLADAMGATLREDLLRDGMPADSIERDVARSRARITSAPVAIAVCMSMIDMDIYPDPRRSAAERWMAGQAVATAIQNMLLTATSLGMGSCWMCAPLFCPDVVQTALNLPEDWEAQALITLGYPADAGRARERKPIEMLTMTISN